MSATPSTQTHPGRRRLLGRRCRLIAGYWLLQSAVAYLAAPVLMSESLAELSRVGSSLLDPDFALIGCTIIAAMTLLQLVFVLPVRPPPGRAAGRARVPVWTRLLLAASAATPFGIVGVGLLAVWDTYDQLPDPFALGTLEPVGAFWVGWAVGLVPAVPIVAWLCRRELPPLISACVGATMTGLLVLAAGMAISSLLDHATGLTAPRWAVATMFLLPFALGWLVATPLLLVFIRRRDTESALQRIASLVFLGTAVELLAVIPIDVFVRRKTSCYCGEGSYLALMTLVPLGLAALGPMVFLVAISKRRRRWLAGRCEICGYDMKGNIHAPRCPECGAGWKPPPADQDAARASVK